MLHYLLNPFGSHELRDKIFESPYGVLRDLLKEQGVDLHTYDLGDIASADKILSFNHHRTFLKQCQTLGIPAEKMVLFLHEPAAVMPEQYRPSVWDQYGQVFTYRDDLVDNQKIFKMRYPQGQTMLSKQPKFEDRKFLTLINANKYSYVKNELYTYRRQAIRWFESQKCEFDLYGFGWGKNAALALAPMIAAIRSGKPFHWIVDVIGGWKPYPSYRGSVSDKYKALSQYKFSLVFENEREVPGWLSEKLFDSFFAGTVPIYLGAPNVLDYVPVGSFIDMRDFKSFEQLLQHLNSFDADKFEKMQHKGKMFVESPGFEQWRPAGVFRDIIQQLR